MNVQLEKKFNSDTLVAVENKISGYASIFGEIDQQGDRVVKGAFLQSLEKRPVSEIKMLWQHDPCKPIGVWDQIVEDEIGLKVEGRLIDTIQAGQEAVDLLRAGAVKGLSIGYRTLQSAKNNKGERILKHVDLWEISLVTFPMLQTAQAELKSNDAISNLRQACDELIGTMKDLGNDN